MEKYSFDCYKMPNGAGYMIDGIWFEDEFQVLHETLDFCGCGDPESAMAFVKDVLELINLKVGNDEDYEKYVKKEKEIFSTEGCKYFVYYQLDAKDFIDHGSRVPGFLTEKGKGLLSDLRLAVKSLTNEENNV